MADKYPSSFFRRMAAAALCGLILSGCHPDETLPDIELSIWRGEAALRKGLTTAADSQRMRAFFYDCVYEGDTAVPDSIYFYDLRSLIQDSLFCWLIDTVQKRYPLGYDFSSSLKPLFQRWKLHFPEDSLPAVVTFVTGYGPIGALTLERDMCQLCSRHLMIGLHYFLSDTFGFYPPDLPYFIRRRLTEPHIPTFVALRLIRSKMPSLSPRMLPRLIDYMVWYGIQLYALEKLLPHVEESLRTFYTSAHEEWLKKNARYAYKELLPYLQESRYATIQPFIGEEPFTKPLGSDSPPRLGWYFGWQAVRRYAEKQHISLRHLLLLPPTQYQEVFAKSGYKP